MKNIFLITILSFAIFNCKAQVISLTTTNYYNIPNGGYVKDLDGVLNPFIGTWKWTNGNSEFTIVFVKKEMYNASGLNNYYEDTIMGGYKYIENGIVIVNTLNFSTEFTLNDTSTYNNYAPIISNIHSPFNRLSITITDKIKAKGCDADFTLINPGSGTITAQWKMRDREHWNINGQNPLPQGFSIPVNVILTKIP
jgi:hypothetical protein